MNCSLSTPILRGGTPRSPARSETRAYACTSSVVKHWLTSSAANSRELAALLTHVAPSLSFSHLLPQPDQPVLRLPRQREPPLRIRW